MGLMLIVIGLSVSIMGALWFISLAFEESFLWGLGVLFCNFVSTIFFFMNIQKTWKPVVLQVTGSIIFGIGLYLDPGLWVDLVT